MHEFNVKAQNGFCYVLEKPLFYDQNPPNFPNVNNPR